MGLQAHLAVLLGAAFLAPGAKADVLYADPGPITPIKNNQVGTTAIVDEMHFEMDITVHSIPSSNWVNVFRIGSNYQPSLWIHDTADNDGGSYEGWNLRFQNDDDTSLGDEPLVVNGSYHFEMDWTQSHIWVKINNRTVWDKAASTHTNFDSKEIWISSNGWAAADVTITNFVVSTDLSCWATGYECETYEVCLEDGECSRNCDALQIDDYLNECSAEFAGTENDISVLQEEVNVLQGYDIPDMKDRIEARIEDIELHLHQLSGYTAARAVTGGIDGAAELNSGSNLWTLTGKDLAIIGLLAVNLVTVASLCAVCKTGSGGKYGYAN